MPEVSGFVGGGTGRTIAAPSPRRVGAVAETR